jgi:hypothetical protein
MSMLDDVAKWLNSGATVQTQLAATQGPSGGFHAIANPDAVLNSAPANFAGGLLGGMVKAVKPVAGLLNPSSYGIEHRPMGEAGGASRLHDLTTSFGADIYGKNALQFFGGGDPREAGILKLFHSVRGNPDAEVTIYRGVPKDAKGGINPGDWVSLDKSVARDAGDRLLSMKVKAKDITAWADSLLEQGYWPSK